MAMIFFIFFLIIRLTAQVSSFSNEKLLVAKPENTKIGLWSFFNLNSFENTNLFEYFTKGAEDNSFQKKKFLSNEYTKNQIECFTDEECYNQNDPCLIGSCDTTKNICTFTQDCTVCDKYAVTVAIETDRYPHETKWKIRRSESYEIVMATEMYPWSGQHEYNEYTKCLSIGMYHWKIEDSYGDGMTKCSDESDCGYALKVKDEVLIKGRDFGYKEVEVFGICLEDYQCNDDDFCTVDYCDLSSNLCRFETEQCSICAIDPCNQTQTSCFDPLPCTSCGEVSIFLKVNTDATPKDNSWEITNLETDESVWSISQYGANDKNSYFEYNQCLPPGRYNFTFFDSSSNGLNNCPKNDCGYALFLNDNIIQQSNGNFTSQEQKTFIVTFSLPTPLSELPTFSPGDLPTLSPTIAPSYYLSSIKTSPSPSLGLLPSRTSTLHTVAPTTISPASLTNEPSESTFSMKLATSQPSFPGLLLPSTSSPTSVLSLNIKEDLILSESVSPSKFIALEDRIKLYPTSPPSFPNAFQILPISTPVKAVSVKPTSSPSKSFKPSTTKHLLEPWYAETLNIRNTELVKHKKSDSRLRNNISS